MTFVSRRPSHLRGLYVPPAWTDVVYNDDPEAACVAMGTDAAGRRQRLYSAAHAASAKDAKFDRVRTLLAEWEDIRVQIEGDLNDPAVKGKRREMALVAYLIYNTGIRPGTGADERARVPSFGATTLQLRHVQPCARGVTLKFIGKKGVRQSVILTNPYLVKELLRRKRATTAYTTRLFSVGGLGSYFRTLGSGVYTPKDFRTACGTSLAIELLGWRKRLPRAATKRRRMVNAALDRVARRLGNTRAVSRGSYVDPTVLERYLAETVS